MKNIKKQWIKVPSEAHQRGIAKFLDAETRTIDELIARKQRMQARLRQRLFLFSRRITCVGQVVPLRRVVDTAVDVLRVTVQQRVRGVVVLGHDDRVVVAR